MVRKRTSAPGAAPRSASKPARTASARLPSRRRPFLTARKLLTNQTFRDLFRTDAIDVNQKLRILSLTFLFTDLKGSTALYERVGDLAAYELVRSHFSVLHDIVGKESGAVVKTIGDAVMATFETPDHAISAALKMRDGMNGLNADRGHDGPEPDEEAARIMVREDFAKIDAVNLPDQPEVYRQCVENIAKLKPLCERYGMPFMVEPLVMQENTKAGGYMVDGNLDKIIALVRQAVELGADIIKADPTDDASIYHEVVKIARVPVLVRGGGRAPDREILDRTEALMKQGVAGIVYGRNIIQHANPAGMTKALMALVHENAPAAQAAKYLETTH